MAGVYHCGSFPSGDERRCRTLPLRYEGMKNKRNERQAAGRESRRNSLPPHKGEVWQRSATGWETAAGGLFITQSHHRVDAHRTARGDD